MPDAATPLPESRRTSSSWWAAFPGLPLLLLGLFLAFVFLPPLRGNPGLIAAFAGVGVFLAGWLGLLALRARRQGRTLAIDFAPPLKSHYIQSSIQLCIYAYWGWYWPKVYESAPLILGQMLFLYLFDALLSWSRGRSWRLGFGPIPIIFSTNLFLWFKDDWFALQFAMIATCALAKEFLRWERGGKLTHIFNPSAFGLALCASVLIATGSTHLTWGVEVATTLGSPPHMYVLIFGLGLVVQYFFSVTLMTLSAAGALWLLNLGYTQVTGTYHFVDTNIPIAVFLGLHLLVTDPSTSPRTNLGRVIFGGLYGVANFVLFEVLGDFGVPDFYDKLLPVPILNLSVKWIDRLAGMDFLAHFRRWEAAWQPRRLNLVHMGGWGALFLTMFATGFVEGPHPGASVEFWFRAYQEGKPNAGRNWMKMVGALADGGSPAACNQLGLIYVEGRITPQNRAAAAHYFSAACAQGHTPGCENVAWQFLALGEAQSDEIVRHALARLEQAREPEASGRGAALVGLAYETGRGRPQDKARAIEFYRAGARRGNADACRGIARLLAPEAAAEALREACQQGSAAACEALRGR